MIQKVKDLKSAYFIMVGLLIVWLGYLPALLLGEGGVYTYHDQLDGEIFSYILRAKHLFDGSTVFPEVMNGIPKEGLQMASPLLLLFFCILPPLQAFQASSLFIAAIGFVGMYLCIKEMTESKLLGFLIGGMFAYLPFYTVYGLSVMGLPLLLYAFFSTGAWEHGLRNNVWRLLSIILYGLSSSLILVGFAVLLGLGIAGSVLFVKGRKTRKQSVFGFWLGLLLLGVVYLLCNASLILQVLGIGTGGFVSHKEEITVYAVPVWDTIKELLVDGSMHARGLQRYMLLPIGIVVAWGAFGYRKMEHKTQRVYRILLGVVLVNIAIVLFCALYKSTAVVAWRNELGGVAKYMQFDRVYWLIPVLWYLAFGAAMYLLCVLPGQRRRLWAVGVTGICIMITGGYVLWNSTFKSNVRQMLSPDTSNAVTWEKFYSEDLFAEIDTYIARPKEEYRVLSLGINPAVALYNEFYCLDGYSNNYDIDYKHKFRKIIESEITDSAAIAQYFDTWGNRCYLFTEELGIQYSINKNSGIQLHNLSVNVKQAAEMGCEYIFSGVEVSNADEVGLSFLEHFTLESSIYEVWLYGIQ